VLGLICGYGPGVDGENVADEKRMRLRYAGSCRVCGVDLPAKNEAVYERSTKTVRCLDHDEPSEVVAEVPQEPSDPGVPGASARREFERRAARREQRIRAAHPKLGGKKLYLQLHADGPLDIDVIDQIHRTLVSALPSA
jgi:hypothetical protein